MKAMLRRVVLFPVWMLTLVWAGLTGRDPFGGDRPPSLEVWSISGSPLAMQFGIAFWLSGICAVIAFVMYTSY